MITINPANKTTFEKIEVGQYFVFCYEMDLINSLIESNISPMNNPNVPYIIASVKMSDSTYESDNKYLISDYRRNQDKIPRNYNGYIYTGAFVYPLTDENPNT